MTVLDTNAVSELMLPIPAVQVVEWVSRQAAPAMCFTTISEAGLRCRVAVLPTGRRREGLLAGIEGILREAVGGIAAIARSGGSRAVTPGIPRWCSHPGRCVHR